MNDFPYFTIAFFDAEQPNPNPAAVTPVVTVDDPTVLALTQPTLTGPVASVTVTVASTGKVGTANLLCTATNADGTSYTGTWSTIAVDPTYIQVSTSSSGGINPGGPILY